ncbi:ArnT family glycosyltransferase [Nostoc sp.]|uniref:ArnT family glycosyltransferase n=1 Tax=Nostoc sp. TaxID=1180 RepID=UPI002FF99E72
MFFYLLNFFSNKRLIFIISALLLCIFVAHLFDLDSIPAGFYQDESSIAYNAALIAQTGKDEYNIRFPIYFKSFGDYKAPIYIYTVALIFKLLGVSEFNSRLASFIFYILALIFTFLLIRIIFKKNFLMEIYILLTFGFLPHFFTISRISFEVISQLALISLVVLLVKLTFHAKTGQVWWINSLFCGLILGVSLYSYPTARLLTPLMLISLWVVYFQKKNIQKLALITIGFVGTLIPYITFAVNNPGALSARFQTITYLYSSISPTKKISIFLYNYLRYFSPDFLTKYGDSNLRHSTGYGGVIFSITFFLFLIGLISTFYYRKVFSRFNIFLLINMMVSPIAGSLTANGVPHALRGILLSYYILIFSCYGFQLILSIKRYRTRKIMIICTYIIISLEIIGYTCNYFIDYAPKSIEAMESFNFKKSLQTAIDHSPEEILFAPYYFSHEKAHLKFYSYLIKNPHNIPIKIIHLDESVPKLENRCLLYYTRSESKVSKFPYSFTDFRSEMEMSKIQKLLNIHPPNARTRVRCFQ